MMKSYFIVLFSCLQWINTCAQDSIVFSSLEEVYTFSESHSISFRNAEQKAILAKYRSLAARREAFNLKGTGSFSLTDNTKMGANFIPAELFGGPQGTFREVAFGQQYVANFNVDPQIDLINPYARAMVRVSKANEQLTLVNNLLGKREVYESIATVYFNICAYLWQIDVAIESMALADSIVAILQYRQKEGVARSQEVNQAIANRLTVKDKIQQLKIQLESNYNSLKILCDIDLLTTVTIVGDHCSAADFSQVQGLPGNLLERQAEWQIKYQEATLRANQKWKFPVLTLFSSFSWQENNNHFFFGTNKWFATNYIGLKLAVRLMPDLSKIATVKYDRFNLEIARSNFIHSKLQDRIINRQLDLEYRKAVESYRIATEIEALRKDSYQKNFNIYTEGIIATTEIITSFAEWINSRLNSKVLWAAVSYAKSRMTIKNTIK